MSIGIEHYLILAGVLFSIGIYGALSKRNAIAVLICIELMLNGVIVALLAFSRFIVPDVVLITGHVFALFVITVAAGEAAIGLAIILNLYRKHQSIDVGQADTMKG